MKNRAFLIALSLIVPFPALADSNEYWFTSDWNIDGKVKTEYFNTETKTRGRYQAEIANDTNGNPRFYIGFHVDSAGSACNEGDDLPDIIQVSGQNISVSAWCEKYSNSDNRYLLLTAKSKAGTNFVIDEFKRSEKVKVELGSYGWMYLSAKGFTREWNNHANVL